MTSTCSPAQLLYEQVARIGKALGHEHRLSLLELLAQGERNVEDLAAECQLPVANTSQHLQHLRRAGLVMGRRDGRQVLYRLSSPDVIAALEGLRRVAESHVAEVRELVKTYLEDPERLEPLPAETLIERVREGSVVLIDVRPEAEFAQGHIPGARHIPLDVLERYIEALPADAEIVTYCSGPYCMLAVEAVQRLRKAGRKARRMDGGFPAWQMAGRQIETGSVV